MADTTGLAAHADSTCLTPAMLQLLNDTVEVLLGLSPQGFDARVATPSYRDREPGCHSATA